MNIQLKECDVLVSSFILKVESFTGIVTPICALFYLRGICRMYVHLSYVIECLNGSLEHYCVILNFVWNLKHCYIHLD